MTKRRNDFTLSGDPLPQWREAKWALERWLLERALDASGGEMAEAGRLIGLSKTAVLYAVRRLGLEHLTLGRREA